jgi:hypothetical protein
MMDGELELNREDGWTVVTLTLPRYITAPDLAQQPVAVA